MSPKESIADQDQGGNGMTFGRVVIAGFVGGLAAAVVALAWKSSQETGKSLQASFVDVPTEAQRLAAEARERAAEAATAARERAAEVAAEARQRAADAAAEARERAGEAAHARWEAVKEKEAELAKRLPGRGDDATSMVEEAVIGAEEALAGAEEAPTGQEA